MVPLLREYDAPEVRRSLQEELVVTIETVAMFVLLGNPSLRPIARPRFYRHGGVAPPIGNTSRNSGLSDDQKTTRPGVIRTHDQGGMSGDEPKE